MLPVPMKEVSSSFVEVPIYVVVTVQIVVVAVARPRQVSDVGAALKFPVSFASTSDENETRTF